MEGGECACNQAKNGAVLGQLRLRFSEQKEYLVYATIGDDGGLNTSLCSRTKELSAAGEDLALLGAGTMLGGGQLIDGGANAGGKGPLLIVLLGLASIAVYVVFRRKRNR
jgi:hypothetical protein